jgi:hypothetical protein
LSEIRKTMQVMKEGSDKDIEILEKKNRNSGNEKL